MSLFHNTTPLGHLELLLSTKPDNTERAMSASIGQFLRITGQSLRSARKAGRITQKHVLLFIRYMQSRGLATETIRQRHYLLRTCFRSLLEAGLIEQNPFSPKLLSARQRVQVRPTKLISFDKVKLILGTPALNTKEGIRDRAILALLFGAGLRRSEVSGLSLQDLTLPTVTLTRTKAGKVQTCILPDWASDILEPHLAQRLSESGDTCPLFVRYYKDGTLGERLSDRAIYRLYSKSCKAAGLGHLAPHSARATAITKLLVDGHDLLSVTEFSRHSSVQSMAPYNKRANLIEKNIGSTLNY